MEEYKSLKKITFNQELKDERIKKHIINTLNKVLITIILFLFVLIGTKVNNKFKSIFYQHTYVTNFKFATINNIYKKYLGNILPFKIGVTSEPVFNEKLTYQKASKYQDGCVLDVSEKYLVPTIESGIVVYIGEKSDYGQTVVIQQINGIDTWYSNITPADLSMYDYIEKGSLIGETKNNKLYLIFQKNGEFLAYQNYI
ncbi:MAG: M23 family metallopeptidase [Tenericutes bacterium]|jgi:stage IV sporulation protein FA|nr:M23 family metallopeptidase [Mycoplasmatota bacterium]